MDTFVLAVRSYLHERLSMPDHAVDAVLTPENREALTLAVDADSNGKVPCHQISGACRTIVTSDSGRYWLEVALGRRELA